MTFSVFLYICMLTEITKTFVILLSYTEERALTRVFNHLLSFDIDFYAIKFIDEHLHLRDHGSLRMKLQKCTFSFKKKMRKIFIQVKKFSKQEQ